jgi:hypothetical protein
MSNIPPKCPSCNSALTVTQLNCTACDTAILGNYPLNPFSKLSSDSLSFLEVFVKKRGNIKEMEREMGQSYWSIRSRLDKVIQEMGFDVEPEESSSAVQRRELLEQLSRGEIDVREASKRLKTMDE